MENHKRLPNIIQKETYTQLLTDKGRFGFSPIKTKHSIPVRNSFKPFSSAIVRESKPLPSKEDLVRMSSKIQMIKSKCMRLPRKLARSNSKQTQLSQFLASEQLDESMDIDDEPIEKLTKVHLLTSRFEDRPSTIFFYYPKCCGLQVNPERVKSLEKASVSYKISGSEYKCIINSLEYNGLRRVEYGEDWNVYFDMSGIHHNKALENAHKYQKINHFPGCWQLGRKDYMWKHLNKQRRSHPDAYSFVPTTYIFPSDFDRFEIARDNAPFHQLWITKPTNQACGRGIKMVNKETKIKPRKDTLVSEYIANPHLINNFKYDLRIYVVVTSYDPLRIYLFNEGLARFATYEYNTKPKDIKKRFIHLTNFSVNKHSKKFVKNSRAELDGQGSKWSLSALKAYYQKMGINHKMIFDGIKDIIIKTCISAEPVMLDIHSKTQQKRSCGFELYGFDILIDDKLKPWLMEVNVCPSLSSSSPMDRKIKHTLLTDTLNLIGIEYYSKKLFEKEKKKEKLKFQQKQDKKYFSRNINNLENLSYRNCLEILSPEDWQMLFESVEELDRKGNFSKIFPLKGNIEAYKNLFEFNRYNNNVLWKYLRSDNDYIRQLYG